MFKTFEAFEGVMIVLVGLALVLVASLPIGLILWVLGAILAIGSEAFFIAFVGLWFGILIGYIISMPTISKWLNKLYHKIPVRFKR